MRSEGRAILPTSRRNGSGKFPEGPSSKCRRRFFDRSGSFQLSRCPVAIVHFPGPIGLNGRQPCDGSKGHPSTWPDRAVQKYEAAASPAGKKRCPSGSRATGGEYRDRLSSKSGSEHLFVESAVTRSASQSCHAQGVSFSLSGSELSTA